MSDENSIEYLKKLILEQKLQIEQLEVKVNSALKHADANENHSRQDCLIFRGAISIDPNHNFHDQVRDMISYHTGIELQPWHINTAHWLGKGSIIVDQLIVFIYRCDIFYLL